MGIGPADADVNPFLRADLPFLSDELGCRIPTLDAEQRIRLDDLEMQEDVQQEVRERWDLISTDALDELTDYAGYRHYFEQLFGFGVDGVDYSQPTEIDRHLPQPVPS